MNNRLNYLFLLFFASFQQAVAQSEPGPGFFETYLPIAQLFDSPVFFGVIVGSAFGLFIAALVFVYYAKAIERKAIEWGESKARKELVDLLESGDANEAKKAFIYLRRHGDDETTDLIIQALMDKRREGAANPYMIYLLEDLDAFSAIPVLKMIAKGKSRAARIASQSVATLVSRQAETHAD